MTSTMSAIEEYDVFITIVEDALKSKNTDTMKWIGLDFIKQQIQKEMILLAYYTEQSKTEESCIHMRDMYHGSVTNHINEMKELIIYLKMDHT